MNKRLETVRDELAYNYEYPDHFNCYGCCQNKSDYEKAFKADFDASTAEHEKIIKELEGALSFYSNKENWIRSYVVNVDAEALQPSSWADKLKQQDCALLNYGGGIESQALQKLRKFRGEV